MWFSSYVFVYNTEKSIKLLSKFTHNPSFTMEKEQEEKQLQDQMSWHEEERVVITYILFLWWGAPKWLFL